MTDPRPSTESELVDLVRAIDAKAPDSLHRKVDSMIEAARPAPRRSRAGSLGSAPRLAAAGAIVAAAATVAIVLGSGGGGSSGLRPREAFALTLQAPTQAAPRESPNNHAQLAEGVEGVSFPYWGRRLGWRPVGARSDRLAGRTVTTVFYADSRGRRIGYAIVGGSPAPRPTGGRVRWRSGTPYRLLSENGVPVVSWMRGGHLCVVSGRGVGTATLLRLASWDAARSVAS
jgi:hypothetical protein